MLSILLILKFKRTILSFFKKLKKAFYIRKTLISNAKSLELNISQEISEAKITEPKKDTAMTVNSLFNKCMPTIWEHEGGYVDDPDDSGGKTKYGISLIFMQGTKDLDGDGFLDGDINKDGIIDSFDVKAMTREDSKYLYKLYFWNKWYTFLDSELLALHLFDMSVNAGARRSNKLMQEIVGVTVDGIIGVNTVKAINANKKDLLGLYEQARINFYEAIAKKYPKNKKYIQGWINRVNSTTFM